MQINRGLRFALAAGAAALATLAMVVVAFAHAAYDSSTPSRGEVLQTAPTSVVVNFQEHIQKTSGSFGITVARDGGGSVTSGAATVSGDAQLTVNLQSGLSAGRYVVNWNNTSSDDGDPLEGAFSFYVQTQPTADQLAADQQLEQVGAGELATATAAAAEDATATAQAAAPAPTRPATEPTAAPATSPGPSVISPAPGSGALPATGTGPAGRGGSSSWMLLALLVGIAGIGTTLAARKLRRR
jgi:methionine-rich copper-binding protein CopC